MEKVEVSLNSAAHIHNKEEVVLIRHIAERLAEQQKYDLAVLFKAILAGITQQEEDLNQFKKIAFESGPQPFRAESVAVLIRILINSGNFEEARKLAADLDMAKHRVIHALTRLRIARLTGDSEDQDLASEIIEEILMSHFKKKPDNS